jgi:hypothetical protein
MVICCTNERAPELLPGAIWVVHSFREASVTAFRLKSLNGASIDQNCPPDGPRQAIRTGLFLDQARLIAFFAVCVSNVPNDPGEHKKRWRPRE